MKELHSVLQVAQMIFYFDGNRKVVLCSEIDKHRAWDDADTWKACLQRVINQKFRDAVDQLEKERLERIEEQKSATNKFFSGLMKKIDTLLDDEEEKQK